MAKDPYKTLEVSRQASQAEIVAAYRRLARKHHPDLNPKDKVASKRFKEVQAAFDVLSDANTRKLYDRYVNSVESVTQAEPQPTNAPKVPSARNTSPPPIVPGRGNSASAIVPVFIIATIAAIGVFSYMARQDSFEQQPPALESKPEFRNWTDTSGKFNATAHAVDVKYGLAYLKHDDGRIVAVPIERLSEADQKYLTEEVAKGCLKGLTDGDAIAISKVSKPEPNTPQHFSNPSQVVASYPQPGPYSHPLPPPNLKLSKDAQKSPYRGHPGRLNSERIKKPSPQELADNEEREKVAERLRKRGFNIGDSAKYSLKQIVALEKSLTPVHRSDSPRQPTASSLHNFP
jgi:hypothetical protein